MAMEKSKRKIEALEKNIKELERIGEHKRGRYDERERSRGEDRHTSRSTSSRGRSRSRSRSVTDSK